MSWFTLKYKVVLHNAKCKGAMWESSFSFIANNYSCFIIQKENWKTI